MTKKYDPLWEIVGEKVALQGQELDVGTQCPQCHVMVRLGATAGVGDRFGCGLCGEVAVVVGGPIGLGLEKDTTQT